MPHIARRVSAPAACRGFVRRGAMLSLSKTRRGGRKHALNQRDFRTLDAGTIHGYKMLEQMAFVAF